MRFAARLAPLAVALTTVVLSGCFSKRFWGIPPDIPVKIVNKSKHTIKYLKLYADAELKAQWEFPGIKPGKSDTHVFEGQWAELDWAIYNVIVSDAHHAGTRLNDQKVYDEKVSTIVVPANPEFGWKEQVEFQAPNDPCGNGFLACREGYECMNKPDSSESACKPKGYKWKRGK